MDFNNKANRDSLDLEEFTFDDPSSQSQTGKIDFFNIFFCFFNKRFFIGLNVFCSFFVCWLLVFFLQFQSKISEIYTENLYNDIYENTM